jgi:DNA-directed RNA polymerase subunit RPC12/RpoP
LKDYFKDQAIKESVEKQSLKPEEKETTKKSPNPTFPLSYWDIHTFSPDGKELIICGDKIWLRNSAEKEWRVTTLKEYFGKDFPLEKEIEEKKKIEEELAKNQYIRIKNKVMEELRKFFRPELINRFDEIIIFEPLKYHHMLKITELQLKGLKKLLEEQNLGLLWTEAAVKEITRLGFDPIYGARPLRRTIQKLIETPISTLIIQQKVKEGDQIVIDFDGESFVFNIEKIELVPAPSIPQKTVKNYFCESCGKSFQTLTVPNSTVICPNCASKEVQEELNHQEEKLVTKETKKPKENIKNENDNFSYQKFANI